MKQLETDRSASPNQIMPAMFLLAVLTALYFLNVFVPPGWASYAVSAFALIVISVTALARVSDITTRLTGTRWHARRFGLVLAGAGAVALAGGPLVTLDFPTWNEVAFEMGVALTWFTTPGMPPWWRFIAGKDA